MQTLLIVNGAVDWTPYFPGFRVHQTHIDRSRWWTHQGRLWVQDRAGTHKPDGILWRLGAIPPSPTHRACLELIQLTQTPCVNPPAALLRGYDRLAMLADLKRAGLPVVPFEVVAGRESLDAFHPELPAVLKLDNHHGGYAKARATTPEQWANLTALASPYMTYATIEPFIDYVRDLRCLIVGDRIWTMERRSEGWRANVDTTSYALVQAEPELIGWTRQAAAHMGADMLGLDFLQDREGRFVLLESNDIPGVRGFPPEVLRATASCLIQRVHDAA